MLSQQYLLLDLNRFGKGIVNFDNKKECSYGTSLKNRNQDLGHLHNTYGYLGFLAEACIPTLDPL